MPLVAIKSFLLSDHPRAACQGLLLVSLPPSLPLELMRPQILPVMDTPGCPPCTETQKALF